MAIDIPSLRPATSEGKSAKGVRSAGAPQDAMLDAPLGQKQETYDPSE